MGEFAFGVARLDVTLVIRGLYVLMLIVHLHALVSECGCDCISCNNVAYLL